MGTLSPKLLHLGHPKPNFQAARLKPLAAQPPSATGAVKPNDLDFGASGGSHGLQSKLSSRRIKVHKGSESTCINKGPGHTGLRYLRCDGSRNLSHSLKLIQYYASIILLNLGSKERKFCRERSHPREKMQMRRLETMEMQTRSPNVVSKLLKYRLLPSCLQSTKHPEKHKRV